MGTEETRYHIYLTINNIIYFTGKSHLQLWNCIRYQMKPINIGDTVEITRMYTLKNILQQAKQIYNSPNSKKNRRRHINLKYGKSIINFVRNMQLIS